MVVKFGVWIPVDQALPLPKPAGKHWQRAEVAAWTPRGPRIAVFARNMRGRSQDTRNPQWVILDLIPSDASGRVTHWMPPPPAPGESRWMAEIDALAREKAEEMEGAE